MKTAVTQTSIAAYYDLDLSNQERIVLSALKVLGSSCIADLAAYLHWERSTVSGRLNGLKQKDAIVLVGKKPSKRTGVTSEFWRPKLFSESLF